MTKIKLNKYSYEYEEEDINVHELETLNHENAKSLLFKTQDLMKSKGLNIYLAFGTLLGAVRDKDFCKGDSDMDVYVKSEIDVFKNLDYFKQNGLILCRYLKHNYFSFRDIKYPNCFIDVYVMSHIYNIWGTYCSRLGSCYTPKKLLEHDDIITFLERDFYIPKHPEKILEFWYYETWKIPMSKFHEKYIYEVKSHYYFIKFKHNINTFIRSIIGVRIYKKLQDFKYGKSN